MASEVFLCECGGRNRELLEYACLSGGVGVREARTLDEVPAGECVFVEACAPEVGERAIAAAGRGCLVLVLDNVADVFPQEDAVRRFFSAGGACMLRAGWTQGALVRLLAILFKNGRPVSCPVVPFRTNVVFYMGTRVVHGFTTTVSRNGVTCFMPDMDLPVGKDVTFAIRVDPQQTINGTGVVSARAEEVQAGFREWRLEFLELSQVAQARTFELINCLLALQRPSRQGSTCTDGEYLHFMKELLAPLAQDAMEVRASCGPFEKTRTIDGRAWITSLMLTWTTKVMVLEEMRKRVRWIELSMRETPSGQLGLFLMLSEPNSVKVFLNNHDILQVSSLVRSMVCADHIDILMEQGIALEQYPNEKYEHVALCLERL